MLSLLLASLWFSSQTHGESLVIHEWGTFTALQDENGDAIGGINTEDEPVPKFVHRLGPLIGLSELPSGFFQGAPACHPHVTMRLETPIIYFYPRPEAKKPTVLNVQVRFRRGWVTEYYPDGKVTAPCIRRGPGSFGPLNEKVVGRLEWKKLQVGTGLQIPVTDEKVWTAPRAVRASIVTTTNGESEKFLFYRGVANINAPIRVSRHASGKRLIIRSQREPSLDPKQVFRIEKLWLASVRRDGSVAWSIFGPLKFSAAKKQTLTEIDSTFPESTFKTDGLAALSASMNKELVTQGLFEDEAEALLNTWELSYFKSHGDRLFFIVPRQWVDAWLPVEFSIPAEFSRVMIGRIELVSPSQRELLARISSLKTSRNANSLLRNAISKSRLFREKRKQIFRGEARLRDLDICIPENYSAYLDLGRFRNALVLDELRRRPSLNLISFIREYRLHGYRVPSH